MIKSIAVKALNVSSHQTDQPVNVLKVSWVIHSRVAIVYLMFAQQVIPALNPSSVSVDGVKSAAKALSVGLEPFAIEIQINVFANRSLSETLITFACLVSFKRTMTNSQECKKKFLPAIQAPSCEPGCGENAHCEYGITNQCACNPGTVGNPYISCGVQKKMSCNDAACGLGAECREHGGLIECSCVAGFTGNPYVQCHGMIFVFFIY